MRALIKESKQPGLAKGELPIPPVGRHEIKIKIMKTAICGTDLHIYRSDPWPLSEMPLPLNIGHEYVGKVVEVGSDVHAIKVGDRVSGEGHITCGWCRNCRAGEEHLCPHTQSVGVTRAGAFADYLVIPAKNAYLIPENISDDVASMLDPLGNALHTTLAFDLVAEDVLITGAGPIGLMAAAIAQFVGARHVVITDLNENRLKIAEALGVSRAVNPTKTDLHVVMKELGMKEGFDVGLEMSGNGQAINDMVNVMSHGAKIALLGIATHPVTLDWNKVVLKGLTLKGIYGRLMFETWYKMINLLQQGLNIEPVISGCYSVDDYDVAFQRLLSGGCGKLILEWSK